MESPAIATETYWFVRVSIDHECRSPASFARGRFLVRRRSAAQFQSFLSAIDMMNVHPRMDTVTRSYSYHFRWERGQVGPLSIIDSLNFLKFRHYSLHFIDLCI
ncbi:hypothetical protein SLE2022_277550 [Rubroshorea leprosula]